MPKLDRLLLRTAETKTKADFYRDILGMHQIGPACFAYSDTEMALGFETAATGSNAPSYAPDASSLYWKIAIAVPDLDLACHHLHARGVPVPPPRQFRDVGYLTNFTDPEGFGIELIQHSFKSEASPLPTDPTRLGGGPCLNLLTLRCHDIAPVRALCIDRMGMRLLSVQPVDPYGFTLYFFAFTDERPPDPDPIAIANRGWTYQRPYTVLEIQHLHHADAITRTGSDQPGYAGVQISAMAVPRSNPLGLIPAP